MARTVLGLVWTYAITARGDIGINQIAEWDISEVATLNIAEDLPGLSGKSLIGTTFGPFGKDNVFVVGPLNAGKGASVSVLSDQFSWPNEVYQVPKDVKAKAKLVGNFLTVADGFLFPLKQTGGIHLLEVQDKLSVSVKTISEVKHAWFYHHSEWLDVDMDGIMDVVAARSIKPLIVGSTDSEFVWFKNNGNGTWGPTQVITKGPGVGFTVVDIDGDGKVEIIAGEFFLHQQMAIYSCAEASWAKCADKQSAVETVIDTTGPFFQPSWVDLNNDGKLDILATAQDHTVDGKIIPGQVLAFEQPLAWTAGNANWSRHVLADGYLPKPKQPQGSGAPGTPSAFHMDAKTATKPHVILSGDDGGVVDLLSPASQSHDDWTYTKQTLYTSHKATVQGVNTIGSVLVADVDDDNKPELFIASYAESKLLMYSFTQSTTANAVIV